MAWSKVHGHFYFQAVRYHVTILENQKWVVQENPTRGEVEDVLFFKKNHEIYSFVTLTLEIPHITVYFMWSPLEIPKNFVKFQGQKPRTPGNSTLILLITPGNSFSFLHNPWNFLMHIQLLKVLVPMLLLMSVDSQVQMT